MLYYLITDPQAYSQSLIEVAQQAESAGVAYFQLRDKQKSPRELLALARQVRPYLKKCRLVINGHLDVAVAAHADGVHLQIDNVAVRVVRQKFPGMIIGYSAHSLQEMQQVEEEGGSYVFISPVFKSLSKASDLPAIGAARLSEWVKKVTIPVFALGGVNSQNLSDVVAAGCMGVAGISLFVENGKFTAKGMVI